MKKVTASRAQRREAFLTLAGQAFDELEAWYGQHPEATFGEIEAQARAVRRALMGQGLAVLINERINERSHAVEVHAPSCPCCGASMKLQDRRSKQVDGLEGRSAIERNYYVCPNGCGETAFPLDRVLRLRPDRWSEGVARVALELGLQAASFDRAATAYQSAVGGAISGDSVRRITEGEGPKMLAVREAEVEHAHAPIQPGEVRSEPGAAAPPASADCRSGQCLDRWRLHSHSWRGMEGGQNHDRL